MIGVISWNLRLQEDEMVGLWMLRRRVVRENSGTGMEAESWEKGHQGISSEHFPSRHIEDYQRLSQHEEDGVSST